MKKILSFMILILPLNLNIYAVSIEADVSAFFPTDDLVKRIYGTVWPDFSLTLDHIQPFSKVKQLSFFGQLDYIFNKGHSLQFRQETNIQLVPLAIGLKWIQRLHKGVELYLGAAPRYYFMHIKNYSDYVPESSSRSGCGGYATVGAFLYPFKNFLINIFLNYSFMKFGAKKSTLRYKAFSTDVSAVNIGIGLGGKF